jgi:CRISPR-associated protein Cas2
VILNMSADSKWYLVCYDVRDERRLRRAAKHLEGYGTRVQYSVFRCWLSGREMRKLKWELTEKLSAEDDVLFVPLCARCVEGLAVTHSAIKRPDWPEAPNSHTIV